jgi:pimeloyl-ACP methyl ester carboxylesterase
MQMISKFLKINHQSIHVRVYNPDHKKTIICWHGLARNHSDFDTIADRLSDRYRVICPDTLGRGLSQWANDPIKEYNYANYVNMALGICDHFHAEKVDWIGTSMGGIIGMLVAGSASPDRIRRLVINDVGPEIPKEALDRIISYTSGPQPEFETYPEFEDYFRELYAPMGERTADEWFKMASQSLRRKDNGKLTIHFDTRIIQLPDDNALPINLWDVFKQVRCPVMLLHGKDSDILLNDIVSRMLKINPDMTLVTIPECGHAPGLHRNHHIEPVLGFLS